ncbi:hypothetical protein AAF712_016409, partial [Marasmius tenuissimus]
MSKRKGRIPENDEDLQGHSKVQRMGDDAESYRDRIKELESKLTQQEHTCQEQAHSVTAASQQLDEQNRKHVDAVNHIKELETRLSRQQFRRTDIRVVEFEHQQQLQSVTATNQELNKKNRKYEGLSKPGPSYHNTPDYHKSLRSRDKNQWKEKEKQMNDVIKDQENQIRASNERSREFQERNVSLQREFDKLKGERDRLKGASHTGKGKQVEPGDFKDLLSRLQRSEGEKKLKREQTLEDRVAKLEEELEHLEVAVALTPEQVQASEEEVSKLNKLNERLGADVASRQELISELQRNQETLERERDDAISREREKEHELDARGETLQQQANRLRDLEVQLTQFERALDQLAPPDANQNPNDPSMSTFTHKQSAVIHERLVAHIASRDMEITNLQQAHEKATQERNEALLQQNETERALRTSEETLRQHYSRLQEAEASFADLTAVHHQLLLNQSPLAEQLQEETSEQKEAERAQEIAIQERDEAVRRLAEAETVLQRQVGRLQEIETSLANQEIAYEELFSNHSNLTEILRAETSRRAELEREQERAAQEREEALRRKDEAERALRTSEETLRRYHSRLQEAEASFADLTAVHNQLLNQSPLAEQLQEETSEQKEAERAQEIAIQERDEAV